MIYGPYGIDENRELIRFIFLKGLILERPARLSIEIVSSATYNSGVRGKEILTILLVKGRS